MNNKEKYIKKVNEIKAPEDLKEKVIKASIENYNKNNKSKIVLKRLVSCAACLVVILTGTFIATNKLKLNKTENENLNQNIVKNHEIIAKADLQEAGIEKIKNIEELEKIIKDASSNDRYYNSALEGSVVINDATTTTESTKEESNSSTDFSKTNVQHENVDEADIVKTDGKYIYYLINHSNTKSYENKNVIKIIDVDSRKVISEININEEGYKYLYASEMYLYNNKLIVMETRVNNKDEKKESTTETVAVIYNIENKDNIQKEREVISVGDYTDSRMIEDNLYIISQKYNNMYNYVYNDVTGNYEEQEVEIELPTYKDTISGDDYKTIECTDIYYIKGSEDSSYTLVTAVNINKNEEANVETFLGLGNEIYCSENNIYVTKAKYDSQYSRVFGTYDYNSETDIFKFKLLDNNIEFLGKGTVNGTVLNQFSMDEYNGYFRIATTGYNEKNDTVNNVFILDENLKEVGSIKGLAEGEKIYSVRFMNDIGYVVTFEQVDPLFVIDLKDPVNPEVKGELKIPGYSSYLHPYDDTHIIGIGMNTEVTKYGSVTTKGIKISMFDVSDLNNPKELFNTILGENYGYSEALNNHKAVLCSKEKELLALPANISDESYDDTFNGAIIFKVDLENNKFVEEIKVKSEKIKSENSSYKYNDEIRRIIYIGDYLYTLADTNVNIIDIDTYKVIDKIEL